MASADRVYVLPLGALSAPRRFIVQGGGEEPYTAPVNAFLVESAERRILIDSGMSPAGVADPDGAWGRLSRFFTPLAGEQDSLSARLSELDLAPADITDVIYTHLHFDHAGGASLFAHARTWVQRAEWRLARFPERHEAGYVAGELAGLEPTLVSGDATIADGVHVLFTPGHTRGHQSVLIRAADRWLCVVGDAVDSRELLDRRSMPGVLADADATMLSISRVRVLEDALDAMLLFSHDPEQSAALPPFPAPVCG
ncbi:MAG TPA: N-acyl homoserine lactonase family protein [Solirubrobacteraceae bacterium]|nr:N-acyl homoserine lactonase family protein [Solirubrobacteraceae bacterium]